VIRRQQRLKTILFLKGKETYSLKIDNGTMRTSNHTFTAFIHHGLIDSEGGQTERRTNTLTMFFDNRWPNMWSIHSTGGHRSRRRIVDTGSDDDAGISLAEVFLEMTDDFL
jgi:hypothetical protein